MSMQQRQLDSGVDRDDDNVIEACPECGSSRSIYHRQRSAPPWVCWGCGAEFDAPLRRQSKAADLAGLSQSQKFLLACPPDTPVGQLSELFDRYDSEGQL